MSNRKDHVYANQGGFKSESGQFAPAGFVVGHSTFRVEVANVPTNETDDLTTY